MDHPQRFIYLALLIAWSIFRLIRYVRTGTAKRPAAATPPSGGAGPPPLQAAPTAATPQSPVGPVDAGGRFAGNLAALGLFIAGNVVIWPLLFLMPALADLPSGLRLTAGVLASLYLLYLARTLSSRIGSPQRSAAADDNNPIK